MTEHIRRLERIHENQEELCVCPTFNSYSSDRLADIAARVTEEKSSCADLREKDDDDDFEFSLVRDHDPEIFYDVQIQPIFPIFNRDLLVDDDGDSNGESIETRIQIPLKNLFLLEREEEQRDYPPSSSESESEADELDSVPPGTYCVWRPKIPESSSSPNTCKKSNSTGSASKRWKFLDLLRRSNSDGGSKDNYVFLTPTTKEPKKLNNTKLVLKQSSGKLKAKGVAAASPSAHEAFYVRNRAIKEIDRKKSYLPYRQDLVGFFASVNSFGKTFSPVSTTTKP